MSKTLKIFSHGKFVGAESDIENGRFLNDINLGGQLGVVVDVKDIEITSAALSIMRNHKREAGSFSSVMLTADKEGGFSIAVLGFGNHLLTDNGCLTYSRNCDTEVLDNLLINGNMEIPQSFIDFVESELIF